MSTFHSKPLSGRNVAAFLLVLTLLMTGAAVYAQNTSEGDADGAVDGVAEGVVEGDTEGFVEDVTEGAIEGVAEEEFGTLEVEVVDEGNGAAVKNAIVSLDLVDATPIQSGGSNIYTFPDLLPGAYEVSVSAPDYRAKRKTAVVVGNRTITTLVSLKPENSILEGEVEGDASDGVVEGTMEGDSEGEPPATGALEVFVIEKETDVNVLTATVSLEPAVSEPVVGSVSGVYYFPGLLPGNYTVSAALDGYSPGETTATVVANDTLRVYIDVVHSSKFGNGSVIFNCGTGSPSGGWTDSLEWVCCLLLAVLACLYGRKSKA